MSLLKHQNSVSPWRGMPIDDKGASSSITSVSAETVQLYYNSSGTLTSDAGQAAGTVVVGQLAYDNVKSILGNMEAIKGDTSLTFTSTALTTEVFFPFTDFESLDETTVFNKMSAIGATLSNGQYVVDYASGTIYGKKTTTGSTLTSTAYKYKSSSSGSVATAITSIVPGTGATNLGKAEDSVHTSGDVGVQILAVRRDTAVSSGANGDYVTMNQDGSGNQWTTLGTAIRGEDFTFNVLKTQTRATYTVPLTASALVFTGAGQLIGFTINSCGAGATLKIWDNTSAATTVFLDTMTFTAAEAQGPKIYALPGSNQLLNGCYFTISGTMSVTPHWNQA